MLVWFQQLLQSLGNLLGNIRDSLERCQSPSALGHKNKELSDLHQPREVRKSMEDAPAQVVQYNRGSTTTVIII